MAATLGLSIPNVGENGLREKFSFKNMRELMGYLSTFNCETQTLAIDGSAENIQTTGTHLVMINGQPCYLAADAAMDISADDDEDTLTAWATATSYSVGDIRTNGGESTRYRCILAHTSRNDSDSDYVNNEPGSADNWQRFWEKAPHGASHGADAVIEDDEEQWFMVTAQKDGTLNLWQAGDAADISSGAECKTPQYDAKLYCPIGFMHVKNETGVDFTMGTTDLNDSTGSNITTTFMDVTGPVFPHPSNWNAS